MNPQILISITDMGDSTVLGGIVFAGSIYLFSARCSKGAWLLLFAFFLSSCLIGLLKLVFIGCNSHIYHSALNSPSGHTALSVSVIGTCAILIASQLQKWRRYIPYILVLPLVFGIAVTRIMLGAHSSAEVLAGLVAGGITLFVVGRLVKRGDKLPKFNIAALILTILLMAAILHGYRLPAESLIQLIAGHINMCGR